jgi:hypothetical protein
MDTRMKFLEHELAEQERGLAGKQETAPVVPEKSEDIEVLERKVRELEAMVRGLTDELLDLKSVTRKINAQIEKLGGTSVKSHPETSRFGVKRGEVVAEPISEPVRSPVSEAASRIMPGARRPSVETPAPRVSRPIPAQVPEPKPAAAPAAEVPVEKLKPGEFEYIMQPDGTILKQKKTPNRNVIIAGTGYNPGHASHSSSIRADSSAVIDASEDDTVTIENKR